MSARTLDAIHDHASDALDICGDIEAGNVEGLGGVRDALEHIIGTVVAAEQRGERRLTRRALGRRLGRFALPDGDEQVAMHALVVAHSDHPDDFTAAAKSSLAMLAGDLDRVMGFGDAAETELARYALARARLVCDLLRARIAAGSSPPRATEAAR